MDWSGPRLLAGSLHGRLRAVPTVDMNILILAIRRLGRRVRLRRQRSGLGACDGRKRQRGKNNCWTDETLRHVGNPFRRVGPVTGISLEIPLTPLPMALMNSSHSRWRVWSD